MSPCLASRSNAQWGGVSRVTVLIHGVSLMLTRPYLPSQNGAKTLHQVRHGARRARARGSGALAKDRSV